jgi:hypothetical protein
MAIRMSCAAAGAAVKGVFPGSERPPRRRSERARRRSASRRKAGDENRSLHSRIAASAASTSEKSEKQGVGLLRRERSAEVGPVATATDADPERPSARDVVDRVADDHHGLAGEVPAAVPAGALDRHGGSS